MTSAITAQSAKPNSPMKDPASIARRIQLTAGAGDAIVADAAGTLGGALVDAAGGSARSDAVAALATGAAPGTATGTATSAATVRGGRMRSASGAHAVRAGTKRSVPSVTSHTRWRAPADARCIWRVIATAATRMIVALASSTARFPLQDGRPAT